MLRSFLVLPLMTVPAFAEVPRVVTDTPVTQSLVAQVMGDLGAPDPLLDAGADPHHVQLRPSQARALAGADLVVWTGEALTPWLAEPVETLAAGTVLTLTSIDGLHLRSYGEEGEDHDDHGDHDHDAEHEDHHDHEGHDHDHNHDDHGHHEDHAEHGDHDDHAGHEEHAHHHEGLDPHLWLDPGNAVIWLRSIAASLSALDPENATTYAANAEAAANETLSLQAELAATLAPVGDAGLVMFHDAYGYFSESFGLNVVATISGGDAAAPGAARLSALRADLAEGGAVCLFPEANHPDDFAQVVIEGTPLRLGAPLDPAGVTLEPGADLYPVLMRGLATAISDCVAG
ncbi:zinc ABC transporter substrate-binding protein [Cereibacter sphaeroides]|nr:zinc ABC transporter substrate-binding protein [Cereibacter sphaeroides]